MTQKYTGNGTLAGGGSPPCEVSFEFQADDDGELFGRLVPIGKPVLYFWDKVGETFALEGKCDSGEQLQIDRVWINEVGNGVRFKAPRATLTAAEAQLDPEASRYRYSIANCCFAIGSHWTEYGTGAAADAIEIGVNGATLRLTKIRSYKDVINELKSEKRGGATAILEISGVDRAERADELATAVCVLMSFATKNTVRWLSREALTGSGTALQIEFSSPLVYPIRTQWSLVPDVSDARRYELAYFLQATVHRFGELDSLLGLHETVGWILDAEFTPAVQPKFLLAFAAVERLRSRLVKGASAPAPLLGVRFNDQVDGELGNALVEAIAAAAGPLSAETRQILRRKLKDLNRPTIAASLDALCRHFGLNASTKRMAHLRSRLMHAGDLGEFEFHEALGLYKDLSHIIDVCLLKALGFDGAYHHWATDWNERSISEALQ